MTEIYWLLQHLADVPEGDDWLSPAEREAGGRFWAPKRVRDWRVGRWTAKRALLRAGTGRTDVPDPGSCAAISILATDAGVPYALEGGHDSRWAISLSHSGERGLCVLMRLPAIIGCDIETVGRRGEEFVVDWFTDAERAFVDSIGIPEERSRLVTAVWSAKESALKALGVGLRMDTREVEVELAGLWPLEEWSPVVVRAPGRALHGWWRRSGDQVLTIVADPAGTPVAL